MQNTSHQHQILFAHIITNAASTPPHVQRTQFPPPPPRHNSMAQPSQLQTARAPYPQTNMRLVRHELRRHTDAHLVPNTKEGRAHHEQRLKNILDA
jgi:hypothetical protein